MNKKEFIKWLQIDEKKQELYLYIPNEIFEDLGRVEFKNWKHKTFAYSYYYLISYLYRVTTYGNTVENYCQENVISSIFTKPDNVRYITKRDGVLDSIGYTKSESDYPITYSFDSSDILQFYKFKELQRQIGSHILPSMNGRFFIKEPVKALIRNSKEDYTGTFYDAQNTHGIKVADFIDIIKNDNLGYVGFYIYAYLIYCCNKYQDGFIVSNKVLSEFIGCHERTLSRYTLELERQGFIYSRRELSENRMYEKSYYLK